MDFLFVCFSAVKLFLCTSLLRGVDINLIKVMFFSFFPFCFFFLRSDYLAHHFWEYLSIVSFWPSRCETSTKNKGVPRNVLSWEKEEGDVSVEYACTTGQNSLLAACWVYLLWLDLHNIIWLDLSIILNFIVENSAQ